jgi:hypothetical protein
MPERRESPAVFLPLACELRSLDDPAACAAERNGRAAERNYRRKIASLARRAGGRLRSLGRVGREHFTV